MRKLSAGFYEGEYKNTTFTISKDCDIKEIRWYWQIGNRKVHDSYSSKRVAILAAKDFIDNKESGD